MLSKFEDIIKVIIKSKKKEGKIEYRISINE